MIIRDKLKSMLLALTTAIVFLAGFLLSTFVTRRREKKIIKDYYNEKRKRYDKAITDARNSTNDIPIEQLLKDGEYIKED